METTKIDLVNLEGTPGTQFTKVSPLANWAEEFNGSTGTISGIVIRDNEAGRVSDRNALSQYSHLFPMTWMGVLRYSVTAKAMSNGNILLTAKYKNVKGKDRRSSEAIRFSISHGDTNVKVFNAPTNIDTLVEKGRYVPARLITVKWNFDKDRTPTMKTAPNGIYEGVIRYGTLNKTGVYFGNNIDFGEKELKYIGPEVQWQNGQWDYLHVAVQRVYYPLSIEKPVKHWEEPYIKAADLKPGFRDIIPAVNWGR